MSDHTVPEAWVTIPSDAELRARAGGRTGHPYDFGFFPAMARLVMAHGRIGPAFGALFAQIMFSPEGALSRAEREMVASVAAAGQDCHY
jgi:hypothetical protein